MKTRKRAKTAPKRRSRQSRPLHKKVLFHPFTVFFWLCAGVFLAILSFKALAGNQVALTVRVAGPPPSNPAVITSPQDSQRFSKLPITVKGNCEYYSYVKLFRNNLFSGTASCDNATTFQITTDLYPGANVLTPRIYNFADVEGPEPTPITVYYDEPAAPSEPTKPASSPDNGQSQTEAPSSQTNPLVLLSDFSYKGHYVNSKVNFNLKLSGGQPPYKVNVDWGDGKADNLSFSGGDSFAISHVYSAAGTFKVIVKATDSNGSSNLLQLFAVIVPLTPAAGGNTNTSSDNLLGCNYGDLFDPSASLSCFGGSFLSKFRGLIKYILPGYAIVSLMAISYWLGEKEEIFKINNHRRMHKT
ncbi:MAG TPA: PKD domain-containing protein [Candidatus Saccharimonadales bacterium]|nr:PKD domain-containing protein [Candidatus Saccharimonadales bacterium]